MLVNRYSGKCSSCKDSLAAGAGFAYRSGERWLQVCASKACHERLGLLGASVPAQAVRSLSAEGVVTFPFDRAALVLVKSMPGARWNPESKTWTVSVKPADLPRTLELADKLQLVVAPELRQAEAAGTEEAQAAEVRAAAQGLYPFQRDGVRWLALRKRALLADDQGLGKTIQTLVALPPGARVVVVAPASVKGVWAAEATKWRPDFTVEILSGRGSFRLPVPGEIVVTSYAILPEEADLSGCALVVDECFPGDTPVWTDEGRIPIREVVEGGRGKYALSFDHEKSALQWKPIVHRMVHVRQQPLVRVRFQGDSVVCTSNHKIWTEERGYVPAGALRSGETLLLLRGAVHNAGQGEDYRSVLLEELRPVQAYAGAGVAGFVPSASAAADKNMCMVRGTVLSQVAGEEAQCQEVLQPELCLLLESYASRSSCGHGGCAGGVARAASLCRNEAVVFGEDAEAESDVRPVRACSGICCVDGETGAALDGRQRTPSARCSEAPGGGAWVAHGGSGDHAPSARCYAGPAQQLRGGCGESGVADSDRVRWSRTQGASSAGSRSEEGRSAVCARVDRVEVLELGDRGEPGEGSGDDPCVYNLEVADNHNYFVGNGLLVSNCQFCRGNKTKRALAVTAMSRTADSVWFLTGTPLETDAFDLFGILLAGDMLRETYGSFATFLRIFNGVKGRWGGYVFGDPLPEASERLRRVMIRRTKAQVLPDLPQLTEQVLCVDGDMPKTLVKTLDALWEEYGDDIEAGDLPPFERISAVRAELAKARIPAMREVAASYEDAGEPLVVFSAYRAPIEDLAQREGWATITGSTPVAKRSDIVAAFQAGQLKGIGITIAAGGTGLTLTRACNVLFVDQEWNPSANVQARDRVLRIGQTRPVLSRVMVSDHPLDRRVQEILSAKARLFTAAVERTFAVKVVVAPDAVVLVEETQEQLQARLDAYAAAEKQADVVWARSRVALISDRERGKATLPEPELTPARRAMLQDALEYMVERCDGAVEKDGQGFNKPDACIGHWLAASDLVTADEETWRVLERVLSRYYGQLHTAFPEIWVPAMKETA